MDVPETHGMIIQKLVETRPCVVIAPDYRKAFTKALFLPDLNDCYDTLLWAKANAEQLNLLSEKVIVAGHSAGRWACRGSYSKSPRYARC